MSTDPPRVSEIRPTLFNRISAESRRSIERPSGAMDGTRSNTGPVS